MQDITRLLKRLKQSNKGVSNVIVVMLSLVLVVLIVSNVVLWSYQMNQFDLERMQENVEIPNVERKTHSPWFTSRNEYTINNGNHINGTYMDTWAVDNVSETFSETTSSSYNNSEDFVDQTSNIDGMTDRGTHSNFTAQQYGPDGTYDTLTEADTGGAPLTITFRASGTKASGTTAAVSVPLPTGVANGDLLILTATTIAGGSVSITVTGGMTWTAVPGTPIDVTGGEKLYVWWARFSTGNTAPSVQAASDHVCAGITAWYNVIPNGSPLDVYETATETISDTSLQFDTTVSTTVDGCMVLLISSTGADRNTAQHSAQANANLTSVTERMDYCTNSGGGGGFQVVSGYKATAGPIGTWTATLATASPKAYITFALKPALSPNYKLDLEVQWTNANYTRANSELCIYTGLLDGENLQVDVWNGTEWVTVINALTANQWNNVSITSYLTSSTFTIRYKATTETDDATQSSWQIDCALLHTWESQNTFSLSIEGDFVLDLSSYPLIDIDSIVVQIRFNATDTLENWILKAYNWTNGQYDEIDEISATVDLENHTISLIKSYVNAGNGTLRLEFCDANPDVNQTIIGIDFFGAQALIDKPSFNFKNSGAITVHIIAIWVIDQKKHERYNVDLFINAGEDLTYIPASIRLPEGRFTVKIVTERGNIAVLTKD